MASQSDSGRAPTGVLPYPIDHRQPICNRPSTCVEPGVELLSQGVHSGDVVLLRRGMVKLLRSYEDGRIAIVGLRQPPCLLGVSAVFLQSPQPMTVETVSRAS